VNPRVYEICFMAQTVWQISYSSDMDEMVAVANTLRNHVIPRPGQTSTYVSFSDACEGFLEAYPTRERPRLDDAAFVSSPQGLLAQIEAIYDCSVPDITATHDHPNGARYFARVQSLDPQDWRKLEIIDRPTLHPLLGQFGSMQFWG
jgi:hypothetical protein